MELASISKEQYRLLKQIDEAEKQMEFVIDAFDKVNSDLEDMSSKIKDIQSKIESSKKVPQLKNIVNPDEQSSKAIKASQMLEVL